MTQQPKMPGEIFIVEGSPEWWTGATGYGVTKYIRADIVEGMVEALRLEQERTGPDCHSETTAALLAYEEGRK